MKLRFTSPSHSAECADSPMGFSSSTEPDQHICVATELPDAVSCISPTESRVHRPILGRAGCAEQPTASSLTLRPDRLNHSFREIACLRASWTSYCGVAHDPQIIDGQFARRTEHGDDDHGEP